VTVDVTTRAWVALQVMHARLRYDEDGSIPEWVMLLVMAVGVILAIMVFLGWPPMRFRESRRVACRAGRRSQPTRPCQTAQLRGDVR